MKITDLDYRVQIFRDGDGDWIATAKDVTPERYAHAVRHLSGVGTSRARAVRALTSAMRWALSLLEDPA